MLPKSNGYQCKKYFSKTIPHAVMEFNMISFYHAKYNVISLIIFITFIKYNSLFLKAKNINNFNLTMLTNSFGISSKYTCIFQNYEGISFIDYY